MRLVHVLLASALGLSGGVLAQSGQPASPQSASPAVMPTAIPFSASTAQQTLLKRMSLAGATDLVSVAAPDDGMVVHGKLDGRLFVLAFPENWNRQGLLFANGYSTPGSIPTVPEDPVAKDPSGGMLKDTYGQGFAVGLAVFDKSGIGTQTGAVNTLRLRDFVVRLGATRMYVAGGSMGGSIVMSLIEQHPRAFAGAVSACGVTQGWLSLVGQLADMRAAYNLLTDGTPYALPGGHDVTRSALPTEPPAGDKGDGEAFRNQQKMKLLMPILALFTAAKKDPQGREARIIRQVAAVGGFAPDPSALAAPLYSAALGMDDIVKTMGGLPIGNVGKVYSPPEMTADEVADFNERIQRFVAAPRAVAYARQWHEATGRFSVPLITIHQTIDALVPFSQSEALGNIVTRAGNARNLVQYAVAPTRIPLPGGLEGYTHCGFTPGQTAAAFALLRAWVETGKRPAKDAIK